jgi:hypothetical protein
METPCRAILNKEKHIKQKSKRNKGQEGSKAVPV